MCWQSHKLGYLPIGENIALASLIDHGMKLAAYILYTAPEMEPWEQCFVGVEPLALPCSRELATRGLALFATPS